MLERFTDRSRKVMMLANQEAQRFSHEYLGTGHILLGLVKEESGVGANILKNLGVDLLKVRLEVEKLVKSGPETVTMGKLPQTPAAKKGIEYAIEEARNLNHRYVGTEHLLLGLLGKQEEETTAQKVLMYLNLRLEDIREEVLKLLGQPKEPGQSVTGIEEPITPSPDPQVNLGRLHTIFVDVPSRLEESFEKWRAANPGVEICRGLFVFYCKPVKKEEVKEKK